MLQKLTFYLIIASLFQSGLSQINPCLPNPCFNSGTCIQTSPTIGYCICQQGYGGPLCQTFSSNCSLTCLNGGSCILQSNGQSVCKCTSGFYGSQCSFYNSNPCTSTPCLNNGICTVNYSSYPYSYTCSCLNGYSGTNCQFASNICYSTPCQNGGTCISTGTGISSYTCQCTNNYNGPQCQYPISNVCYSYPCFNSGTCVSNGNSYTCQCTTNYYGSQCQYTSVNACSSNPCLNGATCNIDYSALPYSYYCTCVNGYSGSNCQTAPNTPTCVDSNTINCQYYAANNFCGSIYLINGQSIPSLCPKSCNTCNSSPQCTDIYSSCESWVTLNYCGLYPVYVLCKKSCSTC